MKFIIDSRNDGRQIKYILSGTLRLSGNIIKKLKASEGILLNKKSVHVDLRVKTGDEIELIFPNEVSTSIIPEDIKLNIIYEDNDIIVIDKDYGMQTHPSKEHYTGTLANAVMHYFNGKFKFRVITRLDKDTSGVVLIAKNASSANALNGEMYNQTIKKEYVAAVWGRFEKDKGLIDAAISRGEGIKRIVADNGKRAVTEYEIIKNSDISIVRLFPLTGRTHQLRVHMKHIGHPIYADSLYGALGEGRCRLHCRRIEIFHPVNKRQMSFEAEIPQDILNLY